MLDYLGLLIVFLASIVAIKGETWNKKRKGIKKVTVTGFIILILALLGFIISAVDTHKTKLESREKSEKLHQAVENTKRAKDKIEESKMELLKLGIQLDSYKKILTTIGGESERQIQHVMAEYVTLYSEDVWIAPNFIYGGSIIKFYGFRGNLLIIYGDEINRGILREFAHMFRRSLIHENDEYFFDRFSSRGYFRFQLILTGMNRYRDHTELAIIGNSGQRLRWGILNLSDRTNSGKIFVESSPRIRSESWSWLEEAVTSVQKISVSSEVTVNCAILNLRAGPNIKSKIIAFFNALA